MSIRFIRFENMKAYDSGLALLTEVLGSFPGTSGCTVFIKETRQIRVLEQKVSLSEDLLKSLYVVFGRSNVAVK